jgi:hypothetical protein
MNVLQTLKKFKHEHIILFAIGCVFIIYMIMSYSGNKSNSGVEQLTSKQKAMFEQASGGDAADVVPSNPMGQNEVYASAQGDSTSSAPCGDCSAKPVADPADLLPKDTNSEWAKLNPVGSGDLQNVNLLQAGYHAGIDTVGNTLRNANLQLRSEPPNPQLNVGPWNNTTISPDTMRVPLEIGCGPQ